MVLEEFDDEEGVFKPQNIASVIDNFPKVGVTCFSKKLFDRIVNKYNGKKVASSTHCDGKSPIYIINYQGKKLVLFLSNVGAPTCISYFEEMFVRGLEKIVVFGTCGALDKDILELSIIIPNSAIRDEGTSYHYAKASREISVNPSYIDSFIKLLKRNNMPYKVGKVWTTDAPYRETKKKILKRKEEGCLVVDMECSAISALAKFRKKEIFQFLYVADNLDSIEWQKRSLTDIEKLDIKEKIGDLAIELASLI